MLRGRINIPYFTRNINSVIANQNMEFPSKQPVGHTGQKYDDDDPHLARFINRVKQTNPNHAIKLVAEEPVEITLLYWIPTLFLLPSSFVVFCTLQRGDRARIHLNWFNVTKMLLCFFLFVIAIFEATFYRHYYSNYSVYIISPLIRGLTAFYVICLIEYYRKCSVHVSFLLFMYWWLMVAFGIIPFYSIIANWSSYHATLKFTFYSQFFVWVIQLILSNFSDFARKDLILKAPKQSPIETSSILSYVGIFWLDCFLWKGYKTGIKQEDIFSVPRSLRTENLQLKTVGTGKEYGKAKIFGLLLMSLAWPLIKQFLCSAATVICTLLVPVFLKFTIQFATDDDEEKWHLLVMVILLFLTILKGLIASQLFKLHSETSIFKVTTLLSSSIFEKSFIREKKSSRHLSNEFILNLAKFDSGRVAKMMGCLISLFADLTLIILVTIFIVYELGYWALLGLLVFLIYIPISALICQILEVFERNLSSAKSSRLDFLKQLLNDIKIIKQNAWEVEFQDHLKIYRNQEAKFIQRIFILIVIKVATTIALPLVCLAISFIAYVFIEGENLSASQAMISFVLFHILQYAVTNWFNSIRYTTNGCRSLARISQFLSLPELRSIVTRNFNKENSITLSNAKFVFGNDSVCLNPTNLTIPKKSLTMIVGNPLSGKSAFFKALVGEAHCVSGKANICGKIAYVGQEPWIQHTSFKNNIIFNNEFKNEKYIKILEVCKLDEIVNDLPDAHDTMIGPHSEHVDEDAIRKISLARALYANAEVYLLDNALNDASGVIDRKEYDKIIGTKNGMFRNKTRLLITNETKYLSLADHVLYISNNTIEAFGHYKDLKANNSKFGKWLSNQRSLKRESTIIDEDMVDPINDEIEQPKPSNKKSEHIFIEQVAPQHSNKYSDLLMYLRSFNIFLLIGALAFIIFSMAIYGYSSVLILRWTTEIDLTKIRENWYCGGYLSLIVGFILIFIVQGMFLAVGVGNTSKKIHKYVFEKVAHSEMKYFESHSVDKILNIFASGFDRIDGKLPENLIYFISYILAGITNLSIISYISPWFLLFIVPLAVVFVFVQWYFNRTSVQLKSLNEKNYASMFLSLEDSLAGISTIKALGSQEFFIQKFNDLIDESNKSQYASTLSNIWLDMRIAVLGSLSVLSITFIVTFCTRYNYNAGDIGLSIALAITFLSILETILSKFTELTQNVSSAGQLSEFAEDLKPEKSPSNECDEEFIENENSNVCFTDFSLRYQNSNSLALSKVNLEVSSGKKLGIMGLGKQENKPISDALSRIVEADCGDITIGGTYINKLSLPALRSSVAVLTDEPVIFTGSLRFNVDPLNNATDDQIWEALRLSGLNNWVEMLPKKLMYEIKEWGSNINANQKQLIGLVRTSLRKPKVVILDQFSEGVDTEKDEELQAVLDQLFIDTTLINITEKIESLVDYDVVAVFEDGKLLEKGKADELLSKEDSEFYKLFKASQE